MRLLQSFFVSTTLLFLLAGCSNNLLYHWGDYEIVTYQQHSAPQETAKYVQELERIIQAPSKPIAPGLYAELGSAYLQQGDLSQAMIWYQKEQQHWPESRPLMQLLNTYLQQRLDAKAPEAKHENN